MSPHFDNVQQALPDLTQHPDLKAPRVSVPMTAEEGRLQTSPLWHIREALNHNYAFGLSRPDLRPVVPYKA